MWLVYLYWDEMKTCYPDGNLNRTDPANSIPPLHSQLHISLPMSLLDLNVETWHMIKETGFSSMTDLLQERYRPHVSNLQFSLVTSHRCERARQVQILLRVCDILAASPIKRISNQG
jgi:hypothetical protein